MFGRVSPAALTAVLIVVPLLIVAGASVTAILTHRQVTTVLETLTHANDLQRTTAALFAAVTDAETGARGFLVTEDAHFLEAYTAGAARVPPLLATAVATAVATATSPDDAARMTQVQRLVHERMRVIDGRVAEGRQGRFLTARAAVAQGEGKRLMDALRHVIQGIDVEQTRLRADRTAALRSLLRVQAIALWSLLAVFGVALVGGVRELRRRLHHHEQIVTMCAWSHTIRDGEAWVSIEDYLHRHYDVTISHGISPEQFEIAARTIDAARSRRQPSV